MTEHEDPHFDEDTKACMCELECCSLAPEICICRDCNGGCGCRHPDLQETESALHRVMDERNDALRRLDVARLVADHWRKATLTWGDDRMAGRSAAHPLCMVLAALDGEDDPDQLGVGASPERDVIEGLGVTPSQADKRPNPDAMATSAQSAATAAGRAADAPGPSCPPAFPSDGA